MVTLERLERLQWRDELHYTGRHDCTRSVGPRGGVTTRITVARISGKLRTWKRTPGRFYLPVTHGLRGYGSVSESNAHLWHVASDCPLEAQ